MNHAQTQSCFSAYSAGELDRVESAAVGAHLQECPECALAYQRFRGIVSLEQLLAEEESEWTQVDVSDEVMAVISGDRTPNELSSRAAWWIPALVSSNLTLLVVVVLLQLTSRTGGLADRGASLAYGLPSLTSIATQNVAFRDDVGGMRMVTVDLDTSLPTQIPLSSATRADVTVNLDDGAAGGSVVLAQFVPVVAIELAAGAVPRASLLVSGETARRIDIARVVGGIRLSLYSATARQALSPVPLSDPDGRPVAAELSAETVAVMYRPDPRRAEPVRMVFNNGGWEEKRGVDVRAF